MPAATRRDSVDISSRKCFHAKTLQTYRETEHEHSLLPFGSGLCYLDRTE